MLIRACYFLLFTTIVKSDVVQNCPNYCSCDMWEQFRRATCENSRLVNIELNINGSVQVLNVAHNMISDFPENIFLNLNLTDLVLLNVSHNKLGNVHLNAFEGLTKLRSLDLSHNYLQYLMTFWFLSLSSLQELYLNNNNLGSHLSHFSLESKTLKVLDVRHCGITRISSETFSKSPSLERLDLKNNMLKSVDKSSISNLSNLQYLDIHNNPLLCDTTTKKLLFYLKTSKVKFHNPCNKKPRKFQQMRMEEAPRKNDWIFDIRNDSTTNCTSYTLNSTIRVKEKDSLLMTVFKLQPIMFVVVLLTVGFLTGLIFGCSIDLHPIKNQPKRRRVKKLANRLSMRHSVIRSRSSDENLMNEEYHMTESTPVLPRRIESIRMNPDLIQDQASRPRNLNFDQRL